MEGVDAMAKLAGTLIFRVAVLIVCCLALVATGVAQTALPPQVSQTFSSTSIPQTGTTVLTITLTNPNTDVALNNISFDDVLPPGLERPPLDGFDSCGGNFSSIPTGGEMLLSNITLGPSGSCTMTTTLTAATLGIKINRFAAQTPTEGFGNTSTATVNVLAPPTISGAFNPFIIPLRTGGAIPPISTLTFTLTNPNTVGDFTGLGFPDSLTGMAVAASPGLTNTCGGTWAPASGDTLLNLTGGSLSAGQSCTVSVKVTGTQAGRQDNAAGAPFSSEGGTGVPGNTASLFVILPPSIFMAVEPFALPPKSVPLNQPFGLFLQVSDPNPTVGLSGIGFSDTFPAGLVVTGAGPGQCSPGATPTATFSGNTISISNLNFNGGQNCQFSLNMVGTTPGTKTNTILSATSNEGGTGGPYSVTIDIVAPPAISQLFAPATVAPNTSSTLTITLTNPSGNDVALSGVAFTETLPSGLSITSNGGVSQCGGTFTTTSPDSIALTGANMAVGGQCQFSVAIAASAAGSYTGTTSAVTSLNGGTGSPASATLIVDPTLTGLSFVPVTPCRIADTRNPAGPFGGPFLQGQAAARAFAIPGSNCGIPNNAQAYALNMTVVPHGVLGFLTAFPCGQPQPLASNLNSDGRNKAVAGILPAGTNGAVCFFASHDTELVLDINGYFVQNTDVTAMAFYPMAPCRLVDTRLAAGPLGGPALIAGLSRNFPLLTSSCNIPATARAYSLNYTAVPQGPLGFLTTWPAGQTQPFVSTLNAPTGAITANGAIVPAGTNGDISVFVTHPADLVIDVNGYFAPPGPGGLSLHNLTPCRVLDTRNPAGSLPFNGKIDLNVAAAACGAPAAAQAYVLNATVVPPGPLGFLTLWPQGAAQPFVSTLNAGDGAITSNLAIVPAANGSISIFGSNQTHVVMDISGYFVP
jgi:uncharacterized repeat protein (TIGR01451 family)